MPREIAGRSAPRWRGYTVRSTGPLFSGSEEPGPAPSSSVGNLPLQLNSLARRTPSEARGGPVRLCSNSTPSANPRINRGQERLEIRLLDALSSPVLVHHQASHQARGLAHHAEGRFPADRGSDGMRRRYADRNKQVRRII